MKHRSEHHSQIMKLTSSLVVQIIFCLSLVLSVNHNDHNVQKPMYSLMNISRPNHCHCRFFRWSLAARLHINSQSYLELPFECFWHQSFARPWPYDWMTAYNTAYNPVKFCSTRGRASIRLMISTRINRPLFWPKNTANDTASSSDNNTTHFSSWNTSTLTDVKCNILSRWPIFVITAPMQTDPIDCAESIASS